MRSKLQSFCFMVLIIACCHINAQTLQRTIFSTSGNFSSSSGISLFSNVGGIAVPTLSNPGGTLTQGFVQPYFQLITAVEHKKEDMDLRVFPNPANEQFFIQSPLSVRLSVQITDIQGRMVKSEQLNADQPFFDYSVNIQSLTAGVYFVNILHLKDSKPITIIRLIKL